MFNWLNKKEQRIREHMYFWERIYSQAIENGDTQSIAAALAYNAMKDRILARGAAWTLEGQHGE